MVAIRTGQPNPSQIVDKNFGSIVGCFSIPTIPMTEIRMVTMESRVGTVGICFAK